MNRTPPPKRAGQGVGPRRLTGQVLDVAGAAQFIGCSEKAVRARAARGLLPHRRWSGRLIFIRPQLAAFLEQLPGVTPEQALRNLATRSGDGDGS